MLPGDRLAAQAVFQAAAAAIWYLWSFSKLWVAYEHDRAHGRDKQGRRLGHPPKPFEPPETPAGKINTTDLDSRNVKTPRSYTQGYNAQAVVNEEQIVLAADA
jgi:hypothetical protein